MTKNNWSLQSEAFNTHMYNIFFQKIFIISLEKIDLRKLKVYLNKLLWVVFLFYPNILVTYSMKANSKIVSLKYSVINFEFIRQVF